MSPEQATGDRDVDPRTDVYALGSVLYEMLVGDPPYGGSTAQAVLAKILTDPAPAPTKVRVSIPPNVDAAIRKALEKLPADRFASAQDFAKALGDAGFRHGEAAAAGVEVGRGLWHPLQIVTTCVAVLAIVFAGWLLLRPGPVQLVSRLELRLGDALVPLNSGVSWALSPDGSQVVFSASSADGRLQLWHRPLNRLSPSPIPGTLDARNPTFSPDGESVAFTGSGGLSTVSLAGSPPLTIVADSVLTTGIGWGPDGMLYFIKAGQGIWRVSSGGGEQEQVTVLEDGEGGHRWPHVLPDGKGIVFGRLTRSDIAVLSFETGEVSALFQGRLARYAPSGHIVYTVGRDGTLQAAPFDLDRLQVTGPTSTLIGGISGNPAATPFAISKTGVLAYRPEADASSALPTWVGRDGSEEVLDPALTGGFRAPRISPDGRMVAFWHTPTGGTDDIWIYDLDQETFSRLTFEGGIDPFWSPDGEVGYTSLSRGPRPSLLTLPSDFSAEARLLVEGGTLGAFDGSWTPDGQWLVYRRGNTGGTADLFYASPDSASMPVVLLDTPFDESNPAVSPDGGWLVYQSDESGQFEVYVRPFPGPGGRFLISTEGGQNPVWAHSGREIFYIDSDEYLTLVTVETDPDFTVVSRERLTSWTPYLTAGGLQHHDLSPDDRRLLAIRRGTSSGDLILVQNFFEELRQVVPDP